MTHQEIKAIISTLEGFDEKLITWVELTAGAKPGQLLKTLHEEAS